MSTITRTGLQLQSLITAGGELRLSLNEVATPSLAPDDVLVRIEASPLNPSDLGLLFGAADMRTAKATMSNGQPVVAARVPEAALKSMAGRFDASLPVGNEAAGTVVDAGTSDAARALLGKKVALLGGAMYTQYRAMPADQVLVLPDDATAADGASCFVNPLTALGMVETMRKEGHSALVHTAAASNLGQMLNRLCLKDGIPLVNIVRKPEQVKLLKSMGAAHVCDTSSADFLQELTEALVVTGATMAFDATGGGRLAGQILGCMEAALNKTAKVYNRYGSTTHKQLYLYGSLDTSPTEFNRNFGINWGIGGWLVFLYLQKLGPAAQPLKQRVAAELKTTFASHYAKEISLTEMLSLEHIAVYNQRATGEKFLLNPSKAA